MGMPAYLTLTANGAAIEGETPPNSPDGAGKIECLALEWEAHLPLSPTTAATGRRRYQPLRIRKLVDRASPLIAKALTENQVVEAAFKLYRPNPNIPGANEHYHSIAIRQARVASVRNVIFDTFDPATADRPHLEEVTFAFATIRWSHVDGGVEHEDTWTSSL
jgi:type VI secretion system secreted protein Hcp